MPGSTEHQIRRELDDLRDQGGTDSALDDVRVEWRDAAPDERPEGLVARHAEAGDHGADLYRDDGTEHALVDIGLEEIANDPLKDTSRWSLVVWDLHSDERPLGTRRDGVHAGTTPVKDSDPPPNPGD